MECVCSSSTTFSHFFLYALGISPGLNRLPSLYGFRNASLYHLFLMKLPSRDIYYRLLFNAYQSPFFSLQ